MNNITSDLIEANKHVSVWSSLKAVLLSVCGQAVKVCAISDTTLDGFHYVAKTGTSYSQAMYDESEAARTKALKDLN